MKKAFPFHPSRVPFFYGWVILFMSTLGIIMSIPGQTIGVSVFTEDVTGVLGIKLSHWTLAYMIGTMTSGFIIPRAGKLYDKLGGQVLAVVTTIMLGASLVYLSQVDKVANFFGRFIHESGQLYMIIVLLAVGFFGIRFFGQGILTMSCRNMAMKWFERNRGLASSLMGFGIIFFFNASPAFMKLLVDNHGWSGAWKILAFIVGVCFMLLALVLFRDNPFDYGLEPDPKKRLFKTKNRPVLKPDRDYSRAEALRTYSFWIFNLAFALNALYITGLTIQIENIFTNASLSEDMAYSIFLPSAFVSIGIALLVGIFTDLMKLKYLLISFTSSMAISMIGVLFLPHQEFFKYLIIVGNGGMGAMYFVLSTVVWPRFFGIKHLGAIAGFSLSWMVIGSAIGPYLFAGLFELSGNYRLATIICLLIAVSLTILATRADNVNEIKALEKRKG